MILLLSPVYEALADNEQGRCQGYIVDKNGQAIVGATIIVKENPTVATSSSRGGHFSIEATPEQTIVISFIGYKTKEVLVHQMDSKPVVLDEDMQQMEEVVVVGYGVQEKKLVTGAIDQVGSKTIQKMHAVNPLEALRTMPSVSITKYSGMPGDSYKFYIRGMGTTGNFAPIVVIDGKVRDIQRINPADIESIEVLKDAASAAIYGSRGANGVILITTKQGKSGKASIEYNFNYGIQNIYKKPEMLNAQEYAMIQAEALKNTNGGTFDFARLVPDWEKIEKGIWNGTDWMDAITNKNSTIQDHSLSISGGTEKNNYYSSFGYTKQEGLIGVPMPELTKMTARVNSRHVLLQGKSRNIITFGENVNYTYIKKWAMKDLNGIYSSTSVNSTIKASPFLPLYDENGNYHYAIPWDSGAANPVGLQYYSSQGDNQSHVLYANVYFTIEPIKNLVVKVDVGGNMSAGSSRYYAPIYDLATSTRNTTDAVGQSANTNYGWSIDNTINYKFSIGKNNFDILLGQYAEKVGYGESVTAGNSDLKFKGYEYAYVSNAANFSRADWRQVGGAPSTRTSRASYFGRLNFDHDKKYMASASIRADGSGKFARGHRWGVFPAVSAGWIISKEKFMESTSRFLDFLKFRASWGQNGNDTVESWQYLANIKLDGSFIFDADKTTLVPAAYPTNIPNFDLKWEVSTQVDIGFDARMFGNRLTFSFDWYRKMTKGWLLKPPALSSWGCDPPYINGGNVLNKGVEIAASYNDHIKDFTYGVTVGMTYNRNRATKVASADGLIHGPANIFSSHCDEFFRIEEGKPFGFFWGYRTDGIFQNEQEVLDYKNSKGEVIQPNAVPGDVRFVNMNDDAQIDENDKVMLGNSNPDYTFSMSVNLAYKGFDFFVAANGVAGNDIMRSYRSFDMPNQNYEKSILGRWHGEGTSNRIPRVYYGGHINTQYISDLYMEDGSFLRINTMTLGYDFARLFKNPLGFSSLRLFVSVQNLYTFTKYTGMDPEIAYSGWASGVDLGTYPSPRTISIGASIKF